MAKPNNTVRISQAAEQLRTRYESQPQQTDLVLLGMGYWGKYVIPVDAATQIMALMIKSGAAKVEEEQGVFMPVQMDVQVSPLDKRFIDDVPVDGAGRKGYKDWIKTKRGIVGDDYVPESYATYLEAKEDTE
jgi:hypothetical protein